MKTTFKTAVLTAEQEKIVEYTGNALLIKGIAGSGKTFMLFNMLKKQ